MLRDIFEMTVRDQEVLENTRDDLTHIQYRPRSTATSRRHQIKKYKYFSNKVENSFK